MYNIQHQRQAPHHESFHTIVHPQNQFSENIESANDVMTNIGPTKKIETACFLTILQLSMPLDVTTRVLREHLFRAVGAVLETPSSRQLGQS